MRAARSLVMAHNFLVKETKLIEEFGDETTIELETYHLELASLDQSLDSSIE